MQTSYFQVIKSNDEIIKCILVNTIKMIAERGFIKKENIEKYIDIYTKNTNDDLLFKVQIDNYKNEMEKFFIIKIYQQKITSVSKSSPIYDFLMNNKNNRIILIFKNISRKATQLIIQGFPMTEIFLEEELMINIVDHDFVPKHILLSKEEGTRVLETYNCKIKNIPKIYSNDPIARYYNMQVGDICKIIRPSKTSGLVPSYRIVIKGNVTSK